MVGILLRGMLVLVLGGSTVALIAGNLEPPGPPASTMTTLQEIGGKLDTLVQGTRSGYFFQNAVIGPDDYRIEQVNTGGYKRLSINAGHDGSSCNSEVSLFWYDGNGNWLSFDSGVVLGPANWITTEVKAPVVSLKAINRCGSARSFYATYYLTR